MGFFANFGKKLGSGLSSIGKKIGEGAVSLGKKVATGLDYGIQGLKTATDFADKYSFGLTNFIPYYGAVKAGINIADRVRKLVKGEEDFDLNFVAGTALDVVSGLSKYKSGAKEFKAWKDVANIMRSSPSNLAETLAPQAQSLTGRLGLSARVLGEAYKPSPEGMLEKAVKQVGLTPTDPREEGMRTISSVQENVNRVINHPQYDLIRGVVNTGFQNVMNNNLERRDGGIYEGGKLVG